MTIRWWIVRWWINFLFMKGAGLFCLILGGAVLADLPSFYASEVDFQSQAISTSGTVTDIREEQDEVYYYSGGIPIPATQTDFIATVEFQTHQGESVEFTTNQACSSRQDCRNKSVAVLYDPASPSDARINTGATPATRVRGFVLLSAIFLLPGFFLISAVPERHPPQSESSPP